MKLENNWQEKSLENLQKKDLGLLGDESSHLIMSMLHLRKIPISKFATEDLRLMIGQAEGLNYLIPFSIYVLKDDLFAEGDFYPGDLLKNVLNVDSAFWKVNKTLWDEIDLLISNKIDLICEHGISVDAFYNALI